MAGHPRLRHGTIISRNDGEALLAMVGSDCLDIEVEEGSRETLLALKRYLDGSYSVPEIARRLDLAEADVARVVDQFAAHGLLADPERAATVPREAFLARIEDTATMWRRQMSCHPLFAALERRAVRVEVLEGLLIETYHFVRSAPTHVGHAVAHCLDPYWRDLLADYLADERGHDAMILEALVALGHDPDRIRRANPVIGTTSLINNLCAVARKSTLGYLLCTRLIESRPETVLGAAADLMAIAAGYGISRAAIDPLARHALLDEAAGHGSLLAAALRDRAEIAAADAHLAINCMHDLKHSFDQHFDQILSYYGNPTSYVPRMAIDYFCL